MADMVKDAPVPLQMRMITTTQISGYLTEAAEQAQHDGRAIPIRCGLAVYHNGTFRGWAGVRWILEVGGVEQALELQQALTSFFQAASTGRLGELAAAIDAWKAGQQ